MAFHALRQAISRSKRAFLYAGLFSFVINVLFLSTSIYMLQVYDRVLSTRSGDTLFYLTLMALAALLALGMLDIARSHILARIGAYIEERVSPVAFERALANSLRGRAYRSELLRDIKEVRGFLTGQGMLAIFDLPWAPLFLIVIFFLNPWLGVVSTVSLFVLLGLAYLNDQVSRTRLLRSSEMMVASMQQFDSYSRNAEIIDALGMMPSVAQRWLSRNKDALRLLSETNASVGTIMGYSKFSRFAVQIIILATGAWLVMHDEMTGGGMVASSIILVRALAPVDMAIATWKQFISARAAYRRLDECLSEPALRPAGMSLPRPSGRLAAEQLGLVVSGDRRILSDISFDIDAGETLAVLGPSAAGKTTLGRLLVGVMAPTQGHVRLDGADIYPWNRDELGPCIGYVPQDVALFAGTVAENIARLADFEPADVIEAAQRANIHDMILRLPNGYDTDIGERSLGLSGGQRQRVALARALYKRPALIVLDEPNSNLDSEGDAGLIRALAELKEHGTTVVFITHRPGLIAYADKLLLVRDGMTEMFGPRQEVLARLRPHSVTPEPIRKVASFGVRARS